MWQCVFNGERFVPGRMSCLIGENGDAQRKTGNMEDAGCN